MRFSQSVVASALISSLLVAAGLYIFQDYIIWDFNQIIAIMVLPLLLRLKSAKKHAWLSIATAGCLLLSFFTTEKSILFLGWLLLFVQVMHYQFRVPAGYLLLLVVVVSPLLKLINNIIGFPLRLWLSDAAGDLLRVGGLPVGISGNVITYNEVPFFVNEACAGMNMLSVSLIAAIAFMVHFEYKCKASLAWYAMAGVIASAVGLNIITNLFRIMIITIFMVPPGNVMHEMTGLICLIAYTLLPLYFIIRSLSNENGNNGKHIKSTWPTRKAAITNVVLLIIFFFSGLPGKSEITVEGPGNSIQKYISEKGLIYVKKINHFYNASHDPKICWTGSGYELTKVEKQEVEGKNIYVGELKNNNDILYTAWWWSDGETITVNPLAWRLEMLQKQKKYYLVNVTTSELSDLEREVKEWYTFKDDKRSIGNASLTKSL